ncbi:MAG: aminotransferase class V-fold PLP-dependent enzyme [Cycloclasticus sp.]|nr:aminotransferase class V-fold PLP-dependent enzyme [Cycloclasticus sp.]
MKVFPRHEIDIKFSDLYAGLLSYFSLLERHQLEKNILSLWNKKYVKVSFTVRTALDSILHVLNLPANSEVIMSAINIKDMVTIVESHDLRAKAVDLNVDNLSITPEDLEATITSETKVLIFAHLFGVIVDLEPLYKTCKKYDLLLIEDCAQAFCGSKYHGSPFADISLFSFGPIKTSTALGGAIVVTKSKSHLVGLHLLEKSYPNRGEYWFLKRIIKYSVFKILLTPFIYGLFIRVLTLCGQDVEKTINTLSRSFPKGDLISQIRFQPPIRLISLLQRRLINHDDKKYIRREHTARDFLRKLDGVFSYPGKTVTSNSFWVIPILSNNPRKLQKKLINYGFDLTRGSHAQVAVSKNENAQLLLDKILYLPNISGMTEKERGTLASALLIEANT